MLNYQEALDFLYSFVDYGAQRAYRYSAETFDLRRMFRFLEALGNPQDRYPILHVAGTKGKGSVAAMCASVLRAAGYRTAFYTSPHLLDFCERAQIDGEYIPRQAVAQIVSDMRQLVPEHPGITTFELTTAMAFAHFARQKVDVAVVEVGLGGRLDATNVVEPLATVISSLSFDHTNLLGNTLAEIAAEKGGIIKAGVPLVSSPQRPEALEVLERIASERGAPFSLVGRDWYFEPISHTLEGQTFEVWSAAQQAQLDALAAQGHPIGWRRPRYEIPLLGLHQVENAATAVAALHALQSRGLPIAAQALSHGLASVHWPGRFEILTRSPYLVLDGAHNADSAEKLASAVKDYFPGRRVILIFGASSDKDVAGMLAALLHPDVGVQHVLLAQAVHPRAQDPDSLAELLAQYPVPAEAGLAVGSAIDRALELAGSDDVILACGSLFVVAEARTAGLLKVKNA
jgi:dihydrofolate synthase / folylpolyglutamate synthase